MMLRKKLKSPRGIQQQMTTRVTAVGFFFLKKIATPLNHLPQQPSKNTVTSLININN